MTQKGYFSGKTEYDRNKKGGSGKQGGFNKQGSGYRSNNDGERGGFNKQGGGYRSNNDGERGGFNKQGGGYRSNNDGECGGFNKQGGGYRSNNDGERGGFNKQGGGYRSNSDGERGGFNKQGGGYRSNNDGERGGFNKQGGGYRSNNDGERGGFNKQGGGSGKPAYSKSPERPRYDERNRPIVDDRTDQPQQGEADELPFLIIGRNAVREAVKAGRSIDRILISAEPDGSLREIAGLARDRKILVRETARKALDELCMPFGHGGKTANHQGIVAYAAGVEYCSVSDILVHAKERGEAPFVIVLDGIMDPHNLGSIIRSADCAGAHGVIIGKRRSASVTAATVKAAAGATEHVPIARVTNIPAAIAELKKANVWIAGADMHGKPMGDQALSGALALVIGGEGEGLGKLVAESCDMIVSIPMFGPLDSLNASVAAGVLMFEKRRQDAAQAKK